MAEATKKRAAEHENENAAPAPKRAKQGKLVMMFVSYDQSEDMCDWGGQFVAVDAALLSPEDEAFLDELEGGERLVLGQARTDAQKRRCELAKALYDVLAARANGRLPSALPETGAAAQDWAKRFKDAAVTLGPFEALAGMKIARALRIVDGRFQ